MAATSLPTAAPYVPLDRDLPSLRTAVQDCRGCELYKDTTQAVFGEGPSDAEMMLVGEQPGDVEDKLGHTFVGPAGGVLDEALKDAGLDRERLYLTNAVKHFRHTLRGKRRIHETPRASEMRACRPWLEAEIDAVEPRLIVCLGSIAVQSLLGAGTRVLANRGKVMESDYGPCFVTVHPSSILRTEDAAQRKTAYNAFVADLRKAKAYLERSRSA